MLVVLCDFRHSLNRLIIYGATDLCWILKSDCANSEFTLNFLVIANVHFSRRTFTASKTFFLVKFMTENNKKIKLFKNLSSSPFTFHVSNRINNSFRMFFRSFVISACVCLTKFEPIQDLRRKSHYGHQ